MNTRNILLSVAASLLAAACATTPAPRGYTLTGHVEGLPDSVRVQLIPVSHSDNRPLADTLAINGTFTFSGKVDEPRAVYLRVKDAYGTRRLMLENTHIEVGGLVTSALSGDVPSYNLSALTVSGSPLSARYDSLMSVRRQADSLYEAVHRAGATVTEQERVAADKAFFRAVDSLYHAAVMRQKDSFWGPLLILSLNNYLTEDSRPWYEALSDSAKHSYYGRMLKDELYPVGMVGEKVPSFAVKDAEGREKTLAALCEGKKYVLIDFWASWCRPCRNEIPNLKKLYKEYSDRGFDIVSISIDRKKADWEKALREEQLPWNNFLDETGVADLYKVRAVPTMYLVDGNGTLVAENLRGEALAGKLAELLR